MSESSRKKLADALGWLDRKANLVAVASATLVVVIGALYSVKLGSELRFWDEKEYWGLAEGLARSFTYGEEGARAFRPPGYPGLLALVITLGGGVPAARFVNFLLLGCSIWFLALLGKRMSRPATGALAALWVFGYPSLIYVAGTLYPQTSAAFLLLLTLVLITNGRLWSTAIAGVVFGLLVLVVPTFAGMAPLIGLWLLRDWARLPLGRALVSPLCFGAALALPLGLWSLRNYEVFHSFVFVATNSGVNLALGNAPGTTPGSGVNVDLTHIPIPENLGEVAKNAAYSAAAKAWMAEDPLRAAVLYVKKFAHYFAVSEQLATASQANPLFTYVLGVTYAPLLAALAVRTAPLLRFSTLRRRYHELEPLLIALYFGFGVMMALFFTRIRFRAPLDCMLLLVVAAAVTALWERAAAERSPS